MVTGFATHLKLKVVKILLRVISMNQQRTPVFLAYSHMVVIIVQARMTAAEPSLKEMVTMTVFAI